MTRGRKSLGDGNLKVTSAITYKNGKLVAGSEHRNGKTAKKKQRVGREQE